MQNGPQETNFEFEEICIKIYRIMYGSEIISHLVRAGVGVTSTESFKQNAFRRMLGHAWRMLKHKPSTTKHSAKSFLLKAFQI